MPVVAPPTTLSPRDLAIAARLVEASRQLIASRKRTRDLEAEVQRLQGLLCTEGARVS